MAFVTMEEFFYSSIACPDIRFHPSGLLKKSKNVCKDQGKKMGGDESKIDRLNITSSQYVQ